MNIYKSLFCTVILCFSLQISAQNYYDEQWKIIENNYESGQYKSNLPIILEIQNRAMKENNIIEIIKSQKAEFSIINQTRDDEKNDSVSKFFAKLKSSEATFSGDNKLIYNVLINKFISDYYQNNSWKINQITNIDNGDFSQIETWSRLDFKNYFSAHFSELEKSENQLRNIKLAAYQNLFSDIQSIDFFPTLADFSNLQYLDFLKNKELFTPNEIRENLVKINTIYDEEITQNSGNPKLFFQHQKINYNCETANCKDKILQLQKLVEDETIGDYKILIISDIMLNLQNSEDYNSALDWAEKAKKLYPASLFLNNIRNQENEIKNPYLSLFYESENQSNKPILIVAEGRNVKNFSINIYQVKDDIDNVLKYIKNSYTTKFSSVKKSLVRKENYTLPESSDYKNHKTALEIKPLPSGIYLAEYLVENHKQQQFYFIVSNSKIVFANRKSDGNDVMRLADNENGRSFANKNIRIRELTNNRNEIKTTLLKTDENGAFRFPTPSVKDYYTRTLLVGIEGSNDFSLYQMYRNYDYDNDEEDNQQAQIFLDRKIYRPGQTVYFKVITTGINNKTRETKTLENVKLNIILNDANNTKLETQKLVTNEFGSVSGSFVLPKNKLNGEFTIIVDDDDKIYIISGRTDFRVEEYKRPKFEVDFEPIKEEYKYGQTIELKGKARMFSGVALSNSTVNYEIKKQNIRWRYFWWYPRENDNENSILGETKTNEKGEFSIKIDLQKNETLNGIQIDNYNINASITDINGETQSAETDIKVASVSHYIQADAVGNRFSDENIKLKVETKNYNEQNLEKSYNVRLLKLEEPKQIFRSNFEAKVQNLPSFSREEFAKKFPHDRFDDKKPENSELRTLESQTSDILDLGKLESGSYKLELYNIEGNDTIKTEQFFKVWDKNSLGNRQIFLETVQQKTEFNRGEKALIYVYSAIPDALVNIFVQNGKGETTTETKSFKNGILKYEITIPKDETIENLEIAFQILAYNDVQTKNVNLKIADKRKDLKIETIAFRDKLQPGQKEKWTIKITDTAGKSAAAEVLANMYDKSLDQFAVNSWTFQNFRIPQFFADYRFFTRLSDLYYNKSLKYLTIHQVNIPNFNWFDYKIVYKNLDFAVQDKEVMMKEVPAPEVRIRGVASLKKSDYGDYSDSAKVKDIEEVVITGNVTNNYFINKEEEKLDKIPVRQNLNETAFFYPNLLTDKDGNVSFEFTSPEALTTWKSMFLAHTKDARAAVLEKEVVTQKEFSVTPNYPRFLREGDELQLQSKLSNLTNQKLEGTAQLQILDAFTNEDISEKFGINDNSQKFVLDENGNSVVNWKIKTPQNLSSIILKVVAKAGNFSDGEQKAIAVLPNRMLVTNTIPIFVKEGQSKTFVLENLKNADSQTIKNVSNTLELTTNPIWEIMFALPSLKNDQNNSADVVFNKWFADVLASEIFKANPKLKIVFDEYRDKGLLTSNLEKNQELKQLLLEETPWILESENENEQMQKIARLFDADTMRNSIQNDWSELVKLQNPDGGFSWYQGYPSSYCTSLYILKNLGKINNWLKDNVKDYQNPEQKEMLKKLISYVDNEINEYWSDSQTYAKDNIWSDFVLDYLDTRNYWEKEFPLKNKGAALKSAVIEKAKKADIKDFTFFGLHRAALLFDNYGLKDISKKLMTYLKETSTESESQGVYWKQNLNDWGWYFSKTVNHAGAIEAFQKLNPTDIQFIEEMKIWLITQKEVNSWDNSRSTAEVIFTILNSGKSWTSNESDKAEIQWGGKPLNPQTQTTGYVKQTITSENLDKNLAAVNVKKDSPGIVQGGLYWQFYEDLDKIKSSENYISISKELYKKIKTENGEELQKITDNQPVKIGDKITVRMILNSDRNMEFVHLKDMRAAGFEPVDVISGYQWKNNLGYYQSTKDASTNFYIEFLPKGKYVFEYDYICNAAGIFSNGIATLQNYYAPQMNANTKGGKVKIE